MSGRAWDRKSLITQGQSAGARHQTQNMTDRQVALVRDFTAESAHTEAVGRSRGGGGGNVVDGLEARRADDLGTLGRDIRPPGPRALRKIDVPKRLDRDLAGRRGDEPAARAHEVKPVSPHAGDQTY